jgi:hypothetical protein
VRVKPEGKNFVLICANPALQGIEGFANGVYMLEPPTQNAHQSRGRNYSCAQLVADDLKKSKSSLKINLLFK